MEGKTFCSLSSSSKFNSSCALLEQGGRVAQYCVRVVAVRWEFMFSEVCSLQQPLVQFAFPPPTESCACDHHHEETESSWAEPCSRCPSRHRGSPGCCRLLRAFICRDTWGIARCRHRAPRWSRNKPTGGRSRGRSRGCRATATTGGRTHIAL